MTLPQMWNNSLTTTMAMPDPPPVFAEVELQKATSQFLNVRWDVNNYYLDRLLNFRLSHRERDWTDIYYSDYLSNVTREHKISGLIAATDYEICVNAYEQTNVTTESYEVLNGIPTNRTVFTELNAIARECFSTATPLWVGHFKYSSIIAALIAFLLLFCCILLARVLYKKRMKRQNKLRDLERQVHNHTDRVREYPTPNESDSRVPAYEEQLMSKKFGPAEFAPRGNTRMPDSRDGKVPGPDDNEAYPRKPGGRENPRKAIPVEEEVIPLTRAPDQHAAPPNLEDLDSPQTPYQNEPPIEGNPSPDLLQSPQLVIPRENPSPKRRGDPEEPVRSFYDDPTLFPTVDAPPPKAFQPPEKPTVRTERHISEANVDIPMFQPMPKARPLRFIYSEMPPMMPTTDPYANIN